MEQSISKDTNKITTIKLLKATKDRIDKLRVYRRETYDEILQELLTILNICKVNPDAARRRLLLIDKKKRKSSRINSYQVSQKPQAPQQNPLQGRATRSQ